MAKSEQEIVAAISNYIRECGGSYDQWYVGIAADPTARLFNDHRVSKDGDSWIHIPCASEASARRIEKYFLEKFGTDGGTGGGGPQTTYVYAYHKARHTTP